MNSGQATILLPTMQQPSKHLAVVGAASLLAQPPQPPQEVLLGTWHPRPLSLNRGGRPSHRPPRPTSVPNPGAPPSDQLWDRRGPEVGGKRRGELGASGRSVPCGDRSWGWRSSLREKPRGPPPPPSGRWGSEETKPSVPSFLSSPRGRPPRPSPSPASSSGKVRRLGNLYFRFNELRRSPRAGAPRPAHLSVRALY